MINTFPGPRPTFIPNGFKANNGHPPGIHRRHRHHHHHHHHHHLHHNHHLHHHQNHHDQYDNQECTRTVSLRSNTGLSVMRMFLTGFSQSDDYDDDDYNDENDEFTHENVLDRFSLSIIMIYDDDFTHELF